MELQSQRALVMVLSHPLLLLPRLHKTSTQVQPCPRRPGLLIPPGPASPTPALLPHTQMARWE